MKKLLSAAMALVMGLSMGAPVLAESEGGGNKYPYSDETVIKIYKEIEHTNKLTNKLTNEEEDTVNPTETFHFTVGAGSYRGPVADTTAPAFAPNTFSIDIVQGELVGSKDINLPPLTEFTAIGEYTYEISETAGNTAGMRYNTDAYKLQVTVLNDGKDGFKRVVTLVTGEKNVKTDTILNTFEAGELVVTKEITGNNAVFTDQFDVTVVLKPIGDKTITKGPITVSDPKLSTGNVEQNEDGTVTVTFKVTDGSAVTIANIPYDVSYEVTEEVTEEVAGDYTTTMTNDGKGDIEAASQTVDIENKLDTTIETGVNLDNLPYILVLALVGVGLISFTVRKRVRN